MNRLAFRLWMFVAAGLAVLGSTAAPANEPKQEPPAEDKSIVLAPAKGKGKAPSEKVENGSAFDKATVDLGARKKLVVPDGAELIRKGDGTKIEVFVKKSMNFGGHPPHPMSIRTGRKYMGCATKVDGDSLILATFGEWTTKEGGTQIKLVLVVPEKIEVEKRKELAGPSSAAHPLEVPAATPEEEKACYWYGPRAPADGWKVVATAPDPDRRAEKAK